MLQSLKKFMGTARQVGVRRATGIYAHLALTRAPNPIHLWDEDQEFGPLYESIREITVADPCRSHILWRIAKNASQLAGDFAEVGVYRGGTAWLLAHAIHQDRNLFLYDTFGGMPSTDSSVDWHERGDFKDTSLAAVQALLSQFPNAIITPGIFPATAREITERWFSFVHIDADIYQSVKDCCEFFYPRMVAGGTMLFDDYGFLTCQGARKAVDEFFQGRREQPVYLPTGQVIVTKLR